jgi:hypothetical protein
VLHHALYEKKKCRSLFARQLAGKIDHCRVYLVI